MNIKRAIRFLVSVFALSLAVSAQSLADKNIFIETYDINPAPCEGLYLDGVTYTFTVAGVPSLDCVAGTFIGPVITNNIEAPNIEGTAAGILHIRFDVPTTEFGFGVAQSTFPPQAQSVIIDLFRPGVGLLREEILLVTTPDPGFVGGRFDYSGPAVRTVTIRHSTVLFRFAIDNVTYFRPPGLAKK